MDVTREAISYAYDRGHVATCAELAQRWLVQSPDDLWVMHVYAEVLYKLMRFEDALRVYDAIFEQFPRHRWFTCNQLGRLYRFRGDFSESERWHRKAIDQAPSQAACYIFLGTVQSLQGRIKDAEETYRRATQCASGPIDEAFHKLGHILRCQQQYQEAAQCFQRAIDIDPEYQDAIQALADVIRANVLKTRMRDDNGTCPY